MHTHEESDELRLAQPALLIIDTQKDFVAGKRLTSREPYEAAQRILGPIRELAETARSLGVPIIYVVTEYRHDYIDAHRRSPSRKYGTLKRGEPGTEIVDELTPQTGDYLVVKHRTSGFFRTELATVLNALNVETLLLTGISTNGAVSSTARDGFNHDYEVVVIRDACAAEKEILHESELETLGLWMTSVARSQEIISLLRERAEESSQV